MHYPWWYVPYLTAPMLIAAISVVHVLVSHYAVGGGLFLAVEVCHAYRTNNTTYLAYLKSHTWFFVLLTVAFGAITGVGIWWTIGLASPLATQMLIHTFVFGWAMEYVFFVLEVAAAFIFFYYWGRLDPATHQAVGWIYAGSAWISLVIITGITAFMLNPGGWLENQNFWVGFFNPQFLPQTLARTGGALLLASLYVYTHASFKLKDIGLRNMIEQRSARPALWGAVMMLVGGAWWYIALPASAKAALQGAAVLNVLLAIVFALTVAVLVMFYIGPYRNPGWLSPGFAILFLAFGLGAFTTGEYIREAVRKPYVIYNVSLGNQILAEEVPRAQADGYLETGTWPRAYISDMYPQVMKGERIDETQLARLPHEAQLEVGRVLFQYHCNDCHESGEGYSSASALTRGWEPEMYRMFIPKMEKTHFFMPPFCGTAEEAEILARYLERIAPEYPEGMYFGEGN